MLLLLAGMFCLPPGGLRVRPLLTFPKRHPVIFGSVFAALKTGAADVLAQKFIEKKEKINIRRSAFEQLSSPLVAAPVLTMHMTVSRQHCRSYYLAISLRVSYNTDGIPSFIRAFSSRVAVNS